MDLKAFPVQVDYLCKNRAKNWVSADTVVAPHFNYCVARIPYPK